MLSAKHFSFYFVGAKNYFLSCLFLLLELHHGNYGRHFEFLSSPLARRSNFSTFQFLFYGKSLPWIMIMIPASCLCRRRRNQHFSHVAASETWKKEVCGVASRCEVINVHCIIQAPFWFYPKFLFILFVCEAKPKRMHSKATKHNSKLRGALLSRCAWCVRT